jgi:hypothetical protein
LRKNKLEQYADAFEANDIDLDILPELTELDLEQLGVTLGNRRQLLKAITARTEASDETASQATQVSSGDPERRQVTDIFCDLTLDRTLECNCLPQVSSADQFLQNGHYSKDKCFYGRKPIGHDFRAAHHVSRESGRDIDVIRHAPKSGDGFRMAYSVFGSKIAPWQSPANRNHQLPEWPTFRPAHLFACFHPTRSSGCWRSPGFT